MARLRGFEPLTYGLEVRCSIQLSYRRKTVCCRDFSVPLKDVFVHIISARGVPICPGLRNPVEGPGKMIYLN